MSCMETKDIFYALGILLTFVLGVWNLVNSYYLSKKTSFINTVTSQRVKWIEQLRLDISKFCGLTHNWCLSGLEGKPEGFNILKEIDELRHVIRLRLNPNGIHDKRIEELISKIPDLTDISEREELMKSLNELIETTQLLLKEEWEKVKKESEDGNLKK